MEIAYGDNNKLANLETTSCKIMINRNQLIKFNMTFAFKWPVCVASLKTRPHDVVEQEAIDLSIFPLFYIDMDQVHVFD